MKIKVISLALASAVPIFPAAAQIAVTVNDGKQMRDDDQTPGRTPDTLSVLDISGKAPRLVATIPAPTSMYGPPTSVAVTPDQRLAIVAATQRLDTAGVPANVLNDVVSVVDLSTPSAPKIIQTLHAGPGATGVAVNKAGTQALVVSTGDDSITLFTIAEGRLAPAGKIQLPWQSRPTDAIFMHDGKSALVTSQSDGKLVELKITGTAMARTERSFATGILPYGIVLSPDGAFAYNTNLGGRANPPNIPPSPGPRIGTISVTDLKKNEVVNIVDVGPTPEHLTLSEDGQYLAIVVVNGSSAAMTSRNYNDHGLLKIFRVEGANLSPVAETKTGKWCQGAAWNKDHSMILLQCAISREIEVYHFDGKNLVRDSEATMTFVARPGAIATSFSR